MLVNAAPPSLLVATRVASASERPRVSAAVQRNEAIHHSLMLIRAFFTTLY